MDMSEVAMVTDISNKAAFREVAIKEIKIEVVVVLAKVMMQKPYS